MSIIYLLTGFRLNIIEKIISIIILMYIAFILYVKKIAKISIKIKTIFFGVWDVNYRNIFSSNKIYK
jgi:hypothetical protein